VREALTFNPKDGTRLAARGNLETGFTVNGGHLHLGTEGSLGKVDRKLIVDIITIPGEELMLLYGEGNVEITGGTAFCPGITLTAQAYLVAVINPGGNLDLDTALVFPLAAAPALGTGLGNDFALAMALAADGGVNKAAKQCLLGATYLPGAITTGTSAGLGPRFTADTVAQ
jgi:hypothetical protein